MLPPPKLHFFATFLALYSSSVPAAVKQRPSVCVCVCVCLDIYVCVLWELKLLDDFTALLTSSTLFICILRTMLPCALGLAIILCRMPWKICHIILSSRETTEPTCARCHASHSPKHSLFVLMITLCSTINVVAGRSSVQLAFLQLELYSL